MSGSYPILSYPILSYPILSYPIISHPFLSYPMTVPATATAATEDAFLHDGADGVAGSIDRPAEHARKETTQQLTVGGSIWWRDGWVGGERVGWD